MRTAWHDGGWSGSICADPRSNTKYCTAPGSLLASRITGHIGPELEARFSGRPVSEIAQYGGGYVPPCYLGLAWDASYMARWSKKRAEYRRLGLEEELVTTSEVTTPDFESNMRSLIEDVRKNAVKGGHESTPSTTTCCRRSGGACGR